MEIKFTIPGEPTGKARARSYRMGNFIKHVTPDETICYENLVKILFKEAAGPDYKMIEKGVPVEMIIVCYYQHPQSLSQKKRALTKFATKKPDWDNVGKIISDALNGIAWHDDSQVAHGAVWKHQHADSPRVDVTISVMR